MTYYVTTHLRVSDEGNMSVDVAEKCLRNHEIAVVGSFSSAIDVLGRFGVSRKEAESLCRFSATGEF